MPNDDDIAKKAIKEVIREMDPAERREFEETVKRLWDCLEEVREEEQKSRN